MSEIRDRHVLYARLEETLGAEPAGILMRQLPPTDDLLTKADLREFFTPVVGRIDGLETRIDGLETRIGGLETRMDGLETRMDGLEIRMERLESRMDGLYTAIHQQTRSFIVSMSAVMASFSAVVIATGILT